MSILSQTPIAKRLPDTKRRNSSVNVKTNMDPIFEHPDFDSARERIKCVIRQLEKPQETFENSLYICFKCGKNKIFSIAKQVGSADEGTSVLSICIKHLYSTECRDCHNTWGGGDI